jgi:hypothetical protein
MIPGILEACIILTDHLVIYIGSFVHSRLIFIYPLLEYYIFLAQDIMVKVLQRIDLIINILYFSNNTVTYLQYHDRDCSEPPLEHKLILELNLVGNYSIPSTQEISYNIVVTTIYPQNIYRESNFSEILPHIE